MTSGLQARKPNSLFPPWTKAVSVERNDSQKRRTAVRITDREEQLLRALSRAVRVVRACQIGRLWNGPEAATESCEKRLLLLAQAGYLEAFQVRAHPPLPLTEPIWCWNPGDAEPPFSVLSDRLRTRWREALKPTKIFTASKRTAHLYGGSGGRLSHPLQVNHDLHVAAIFLRLLRESPLEASGWISEDTLARTRRGQKLPDAEIYDPDGRLIKVIEFGGAYSADRCRMVHADCAERNLPYELW